MEEVMAEHIDVECNKCESKFSMCTINHPDQKLDDYFTLQCPKCGHVQFISMLRESKKVRSLGQNEHGLDISKYEEKGE